MPFWLRLARDARSVTIDGQPAPLTDPCLMAVPAGSHALQLRQKTLVEEDGNGHQNTPRLFLWVLAPKDALG